MYRAITSCCSLDDGLAACLKLPPPATKAKDRKHQHQPDPSLPSAVDLCVEILVKENRVPAVAGGSVSTRAAEASRALGFICFSETGRDLAITSNAVEALVAMLVRLRELSENEMGDKSTPDSEERKRGLSQAKLSTVNALSVITASDEAKLRYFPCEESVNIICYLITRTSESEQAVLISTLKLISNVSVHPETRRALREVSAQF